MNCIFIRQVLTKAEIYNQYQSLNVTDAGKYGKTLLIKNKTANTG